MHSGRDVRCTVGGGGERVGGGGEVVVVGEEGAEEGWDAGAT